HPQDSIPSHIDRRQLVQVLADSLVEHVGRRTLEYGFVSSDQPSDLLSLRVMKFRAFGRSGLNLSVAGLGCGGFGGVGSERDLFGQGESEAEACALMDAAFAMGINYFDTANSYGGGRSEEIVGRWLEQRRLRDQIVLGTKVGTPLEDG